ncbi:type II secretion system protein GspM [Sphingomonas japonica]|uniref:General secretion pathway protein M n=1 Tax=Sphingomonas japonica TaxID=511662 RepID=A0ABX0U071_9SPHN|nr:type II secretion system protein GspM [Sphingomonas japonica]NIJ23106.1 general secretion pathway protein M [Sphingomonas japonica]
MKIVRVIERSGIEATLLRLDRWWSGLSGRERVLVSVLATLLAIAVLVFGVIKPLQAARAQAIADIRTFEGLNARLRAVGTIAPQAARRTGAPEAIVLQAANGFGLTATTTPDAGGVRAVVADGSYDSVVNWIADVAGSSSLAPVRVQITRRAEPGRVAAQVDFAP